MPDGGAQIPVTTFVPSAETERDLRDALGRFATGVTVVTTQTEAGPVGITANSFASVSLDPPLVLWSPARASRRFPAFAGCRHFAIHVLGEEQAHLCGRFAREGAGFDGLDWATGDSGAPEIRGCLARFDCVHHAAHDGGDHLIIVGRVLAFEHRTGRPLLFSSGRYGRFTDAS